MFRIINVWSRLVISRLSYESATLRAQLRNITQMYVGIFIGKATMYWVIIIIILMYLSMLVINFFKMDQWKCHWLKQRQDFTKEKISVYLLIFNENSLLLFFKTKKYNFIVNTSYFYYLYILYFLSIIILIFFLLFFCFAL